MYTDMTDWGFKAPTRTWTDPNEVEAQAIQQLRNIAALRADLVEVVANIKQVLCVKV